MSVDLTRLDITALLHSRVELGRRLHATASLEAAAQAACRHFYEDLRAPSAGAGRACVLVRCFKTHPYGRLEPALQQCARELMPPGRSATEHMPCLTLMASMGDEPAWCSRQGSERRRCLPLDSPSAIERAPMWSGFLHDSGIDTSALFQPRAAAFVDHTPRAVNVFCVEDAVGAASIPDQEMFVTRFGVRSVFGFCSHLRRGDLCVIVFFSRLPVTRASAARLRPLGLEVTSTLFRFPDEQTFAPASA
jgi:hypothetical protein